MTTDTLNVLGTTLESCSVDPLTGFQRDGFCSCHEQDVGQHTICVVVDAPFLKYSKAQGNDLISPILEIGFPGLLPDDQWCVCLPRWVEAYRAGVAPKVKLRATHIAVLDDVPLEILEQCAYSDA
ncbi:MAG: DUF2237 domain-containing protein [Pseudomonadota bacterium]